MQINVTARHLSIEEPFKVYINEKLSKLTKYNSKIEEARVVLSMEKFSHVAEIVLMGKRFRMAAVEEHDNLKNSFDRCFMNMEKQLKRFRTMGKGHRVKRLFAPLRRLSLRKTGIQEEEPQIIKTDSFTTKPMSQEEAVLELNLFKKEFIAFRNLQDDNINVLYRRKDGNYGLIES